MYLLAEACIAFYVCISLNLYNFRNRLKNSSLTYKITFGYWLSRSFVVKFAPPGKHAHGSWYDVSVYTYHKFSEHIYAILISLTYICH